MRTAILTDSTAYIPPEVRKEYGIHMIPLNVIFGNESYQEEVEISASDFYEQVKHSEELPKTSQPSIGLFVTTLQNLAKDYDAVISIHLSSAISGTFQAAITASGMVEKIKMYAYDTEISCMAQGFYALEAAKLAQEGQEPEAIIERLDQIKQTSRAYFMVDDLKHLQRGGRLNGAQAIVGSLLQVKPILHFVDKQIVPFEKIRTEKKAWKRIMDLFAEDATIGDSMKASVIHANRLEKAEEIQREIQEKYPNVDVSISYFGPVIGTHLGEGALGLAWYVE